MNSLDIHQLNGPQRQAVQTTQGPVLILAGAGSGKTKTLIFRIAHMVKDLGINPRQILGVTFTNKAAQEMQERLRKMGSRQTFKGITLSTFHSLGLRILREEFHHLKRGLQFSLYDTSDQISIVREALRNFKSQKKFDQKVILGKIGKLKNSLISAEEFSQSSYYDPEDPYDDAIHFVYHYYQEKLELFNAIDFDDILFLTVKLLSQRPELAQKYSQQFQYIMVDEYQDTNRPQFRLIEALTSSHKNLCVVGDDDQSIYGFRGADVGNILAFEKQFPGAKVIKLEQNYRSVSPILNLANQVIAENKNRYPKKLWSESNSAQMPLLWSMGDEDHEAQIVVEDVLNYQKEGGLLSEAVVLFRSNAHMVLFENELRLSQIPYKIIGGQKFYEKKEIKDLMGYMSFILNPQDELALRRIINTPARGIGKETIKKIGSIAQNQKLSFRQAMDQLLLEAPMPTLSRFQEQQKKWIQYFQDLPLPEAIEKLVENVDYHQFIEKSYDSASQVDRRKKDIEQFIQAATKFHQSSDAQWTLKAFVEKLLLQDSQDHIKSQEQSGPDNRLTLMTLHSSKGLEFNRVYLVSVEDEILPHKRSLGEKDGEEEERRLFYVGITRAKRQLIISYCKERNLYGQKVPRNMSRFLKNSTELVKDQDRTTFSHLGPDEVEQYKKDFFSDLHSFLE